MRWRPARCPTDVTGSEMRPGRATDTRWSKRSLRSRSSGAVRRDGTAGFGTGATGGRALAHLRIADALAAFGAPDARVRAQLAHPLVPLRASNQQIGCGSADLRAVEHQPNVPRLGMLAAFDQAMREHGIEAHTITAQRMIDRRHGSCGGHGDGAVHVRGFLPGGGHGKGISTEAGGCGTQASTSSLPADIGAASNRRAPTGRCRCRA